jgi:hypothetical protein
MSAKNESSDTITPQELAQILVLSDPEIVRLTKLQVLMRSTERRNGRDRIVYVWRDNVRRYVLHVRRPTEELRESYQEEKRLTQQIVREQKQLELRIARGEMVDRALVLEEMTRSITQAKNHLLGLPARLARQMIGLKDPNKARQLLETNIRNCLTEVSKIGAHSFIKVSKNGSKGSKNDAIARVKKRVQRRRKTSSS